MNTNLAEKLCRILITFAFVVSAVGMSAAQAHAYQGERNIPPDLGIISYWNFDEGGGEVAADSADGNTGTLVNNPVWTQGKVGGALEFDGASTYVQLPDSSNLKPSDALTLEFWMYPHEVGVDKHIFGSHSTCNFHPWHIGLWYSNGIVFRINDHPALYVSDVVSTPNVWYHVVATFDKNSGRKVYVNGAEVASDTYSSPTCGDAGDIFRIGGRFTTPDMYAFDGILDEVVFYNRAVSAEEIQQHYQNGLNGQPYWDLDGVPIPRFHVQLTQNNVEGYDWPLGTSVTITIDTDNDGTPEFTSSPQTVIQADWDPNSTVVRFDDVGGIDLAAGMVVTMKDGATIKTHTVTILTLTSVDPVTDQVTGTAAPNSYMEVGHLCDQNGCAIRRITADAYGNWAADFSVPGAGTDPDEQRLFDIKPGMGNEVRQPDEDGDHTDIDWNVPNPRIFVVDSHYSNCCAYNVVGGEQWEPGKTISLSIDDPSNGAGWDYQDSLVALDGQHGWANSQWTFNIDPQVFQIQPGHIVQVTDGTTVKEHVVKDLVITDIDLNSDTVEGRSNSDEQLYVPVMVNDQYAQRFVSPDINGHWIADFSQPGEQGNEQAVFDITRGTLVIPEQADEDGDSTKLWWQQPNPYFFVDFAGEHIFAFQWPVGAMVTVTIDDPETPEVDFMETQPVRTDNPWGSETWIDFQSPIPFKSGLLITMTDGNTVKTHTVTNLTITEANSDTDTVSGTATPGALVRAWIHDPVCCIMRHVIADADGQWVADYSIPGDEDFEIETFDLQPGNSGQASQPDEDTDATNKPWQVPNPVFSVLPDENSIEGNDWPLESILTIKVGDPDNADYTTTTAVNAADLEHSQTWFKLDLANIFDLQPGQIVTVSDTKTTKQTIIVPRNITLIDLATDTITGEAEPNILNVVLWTLCVDNDCAVRIKDVNTDGSWFVNFGVPGEQPWEDDIVDIQPDTTGGIYQGDTDGDGTTYLEWSLRNRMPVANSGLDRILYAGETITLDASASFDPEGGTLTYAWDLDNDGLYDDATGVTVQVSFSQVGAHVIGLQVTDVGGLSDTDTATVTILPWTLKGFYQPVDMNGVYNLVKGGSTIPLKFEIFAGSTELTDIFDVKSLTYAETACDLNAATDEIELTTTGSTSLRYDTQSGQFIYNWKTPSTTGKCYRVTMTTMDNSSLMAYFKIK